jgi:hypothetical protein
MSIENKYRFMVVIFFLMIGLIATNLVLVAIQSSSSGVAYSPSGLTANVPIGDSLVVGVTRHFLRISPTEDHVRIEWFFLGWRPYSEIDLENYEAVNYHLFLRLDRLNDGSVNVTRTIPWFTIFMWDW